MATLRIHMPGTGIKVYHIYKKLTSLGKSEGVDILLPDPLLADTHAHIHFDGRDFNISVTDKDADLHVQRGVAAASTGWPRTNRIRVGSVELQFSLYDEPVTDDVAAKTMAELNSYKRLFEFSQRLMGQLRDSVLARPVVGRGHQGHQCRQRLHRFWSNRASQSSRWRAISVGKRFQTPSATCQTPSWPG